MADRLVVVFGEQSDEPLGDLSSSLDDTGWEACNSASGWVEQARYIVGQGVFVKFKGAAYACQYGSASKSDWQAVVDGGGSEVHARLYGSSYTKRYDMGP